MEIEKKNLTIAMDVAKKFPPTATIENIQEERKSFHVPLIPYKETHSIRITDFNWQSMAWEIVLMF